MTKGILYGVGVGPGDPELMTVKAVRTVERCPVIALPQSGRGECTAYEIAKEAVPALEKKKKLLLSMPMTRDQDTLLESWREAADQIAKKLDLGQDVAFLTLGDPAVYSTYLYLHRLVEKMGYEARMIPGVPSFCAAAARLGWGLCENRQPLHILPASYDGTEEALSLPGTKVLMKAGSCAAEVMDALGKGGLRSRTGLVVNCGMAGEKAYQSLETTPEEQGYFSLYIVKEEE